MAIDFKSNINLGGNQIQNVLLHPTGTVPSSPAEGQVYFDTNTNNKKLYVYDGAVWIDVTGDIRTITAGTGIGVSNGSGGDATVSLTHLGLENLTAISSEGADAIFMYDASGSSAAYLSVTSSTGITIDATNNTLKLASIPNASLANSTITVTGGAGLTATAGATALGGTTSVAVGAGTGIAVETDAVALKNHAGLSDDTILMWDDTNGQLIDSPLSDDGTNVTVGDSRNLVIAGNLTVQGSTTTVDSNTVNIGDNIIVLNADETAAASQNAGIEIERGTDANKKFYWDEALDSWRVEGQLIIDDVPDVSGTNLSTHILVEKTAAGGDTTIEKTDVAAIGAAIGVGLYSVLLDPGRTNVAKTGNVYTVTHGLGTKLVKIEIVDASTYETVFVEVARPSTTTATISFAQTVANAAYICMISAVANLDTTGDLTP